MAEQCFKCGYDMTLADNGMLYCKLCKEYRLPRDPLIDSKLSFANDLRLRAEFDRAAYEYEEILKGNSKNVKAHWGLFLSRYGILYEKDPATLKMIPTINRLTRTSVRDDPNFKYAVENMQPKSLQMQYGYDGKYINDVLSESLKKVANEKPCDVFICYKKGEDTNLAYDLYNKLTNKGFKVFFAEVSIQAGKYEPQIFSALVTAKVMIVLATKKDYLESVWVKNEWSRFNRMVMDDPASKVIINAYKSDKPVDRPPELIGYQAFNMNDLDFLDRVINEIKKRVKPESIPNPISNHDAFIDRGKIALNDKEYANAEAFFEKALNIKPRSYKAYIGKLMAQLRVNKLEHIITSNKYLNEYSAYNNAFKFSDERTKAVLYEYEKKVKSRIDSERVKALETEFNKATSLEDWTALSKKYDEIKECSVAQKKKKVCQQMIDNHNELLELEKRKKEISSRKDTGLAALHSNTSMIIVSVLMFVVAALFVAFSGKLYDFLYDPFGSFLDCSQFIADAKNLIIASFMLMALHCVLEGLFVLSTKSNIDKRNSLKNTINNYINAIDNDVNVLKSELDNRAKGVSKRMAEKNSRCRTDNLSAMQNSYSFMANILNVLRTIALVAATAFFTIVMFRCVYFYSDGTFVNVCTYILSVALFIAFLFIVYGMATTHMNNGFLIGLALVPLLFPFIAGASFFVAAGALIIVAIIFAIKIIISIFGG